MKFYCMMTTINFLPNSTDFQSFEQLTEQICGARLETWYEKSWRPIMNHESHFNH